MGEDGIYRAILWILVITVVAGALVTLAGEYLTHSQAMVRVGSGAVLIGGGVYFFFRWLGRRRGPADTAREPPDRPRD